MKEQYPDQNYIRSYLLGRLSGSERELFEERIFSEPAFFERVQMTEDELLEDYYFNILPPEEAEIVADRLIRTPEQRQKLQMSAALKKYSDAVMEPATMVTPAPPPKLGRTVDSRWMLTVAATVIVAVAVGIWAIRSTSLSRSVASLNGPGVDMQSDFAIELPALRLRSDPRENVPEQRATIPKGLTVVQLRLPVQDGSYAKYETTLIREPDATLFTLADRVPVSSGNRKLLVIRVPAGDLGSGEYRLLVKGIASDGRVDDLGGYNFTIL